MAFSIVQLIRHVAEKISQGNFGFTGAPFVHHGIGVEVQGVFTDMVQVMIESQPGVARGECGDEDIGGLPPRGIVEDFIVRDF